MYQEPLNIFDVVKDLLGIKLSHSNRDYCKAAKQALEEGKTLVLSDQNSLRKLWRKNQAKIQEVAKMRAEAQMSAVYGDAKQTVQADMARQQRIAQMHKRAEERKIAEEVAEKRKEKPFSKYGF